MMEACCGLCGGVSHNTFDHPIARGMATLVCLGMFFISARDGSTVLALVLGAWMVLLSCSSMKSVRWGV